MTLAFTDARTRVENALTHLAAARQASPDTEVAGVYLLALSDVDPGLIERACHELAKEPRRDYAPALPDVGTIRARATAIQKRDEDAAARSRLLPMPGRETLYHCLACFDEISGWAIKSCTGSGPHSDVTRGGYCGRSTPHDPHTFAERCQCYGTNPISAAKRDRLRSRRAAAGDRE